MIFKLTRLTQEETEGFEGPWFMIRLHDMLEIRSDDRGSGEAATRWLEAQEPDLEDPFNYIRLEAWLQDAGYDAHIRMLGFRPYTRFLMWFVRKAYRKGWYTG